MNRLTGLWMCHGSCGRTGNAFQLARELGCLPTRPARPSLPPTIDWGIDLVRFDVTVTDKAVVFPIIDHDGNACRRHVRYHKPRGKRFEFWDKDTGRRTYHAYVPSWDLLRQWGAGCGICYVVEGNRDALTLAAHEWPAIGILGVEHFDKALGDIAEPLGAIGIGAIVLTPDSDERGIEAVTEWAPKLEAAGFVVGVRILPDSVNGVPIKDTFDAFSADHSGFESLIDRLPVSWRGA